MVLYRNANQNQRRCKFLGFFIMCFFAIVVARLLYLQIWLPFTAEGADLLQRVDAIQNDEVMLDSGRGKILDRHRQPIVGELTSKLLLFPYSEQQIDLRQDKLTELSRLIQVDKSLLVAFLKGLKRPTFAVSIAGQDVHIDAGTEAKIQSLKLPGVYVLNSDGRNNSLGIGAQLLGFITKKNDTSNFGYVGVTGLESTFNYLLQGSQEKKAAYLTDRAQRVLTGAEIKLQEESSIGSDINSGSKKCNSLVTTLELDIQKGLEKILDDSLKNTSENPNRFCSGASIVVQDVKTGDILGMASRPNQRLDANDMTHWTNQATSASTPGSIFKIVTAIAALEEKIVTPKSRFVCMGMWDKYNLKDAIYPNSHGVEDFEHAFANSCNVVFSQVAHTLGGAKLAAYAQRLGLGKQIIWSSDFKQLKDEQAGRIFMNKESMQDGGAVAQTGIGQRDVIVTPLQASNMLVSLLNRGITKEPRIVSEVLDANNNPTYTFGVKNLEEALTPFKPETVSALLRMMRLTVTDGTAKPLLDTKLPVAAKTGTAQTGEENDKYHRWLIGYLPSDKPLYAISAVIKSVSDDKDGIVTHIFKETSNLLCTLKKDKVSAKK